MIILDVPKVTENLDVQVGSHTDNLMNLDKWDRAPVIVEHQTLTSGINKINSPFVGLIYLIPTKSEKYTKVKVSINGAINAPYFILGKTTDEEWKNTIRNYPAPWAGLQSGSVILTVPSEDIRKLDNLRELMAKWD